MTASGREIRVTRVFEAPRHLVFEAMTRPQHLRQWLGCPREGDSVVFCDIDLRPGGAWRFVNRQPKGDLAFSGVYREIAPPERLVFTEVVDDCPGTEKVVTAELTEEGGGTRLTVTVR